MSDRAEDTGADGEFEEQMDDQNQNKVQEWMTPTLDDILDVSCVHFHEEFRRHHDELLEALWAEVCYHLTSKKLISVKTRTRLLIFIEFSIQ